MADKTRINMSYIGLRTNKRNGENLQFKDAITFEFALDTSVPIQITSPIRLEDGNKILLETDDGHFMIGEDSVVSDKTQVLISDSGSFELKGIVNLLEGQNLALGSPGTTDVTLTGTGSIIGEGTVTGGGFG